MSLGRYQHTFRLFVSSTFEDLKQERRALHQWVFPRLRDLCESAGCRFQPIDLRWSIRVEAGLDHQTLNLCLDEVRLCIRSTVRPNFLVLLGQRYGWRPLPSEITTAQFAKLIAACDSHADGEALGLVREWYLFDENIARGGGSEGAGGYHLRPRTAPWIDHHRWTDEIEAPLQAAFDRLSDVDGLLSATEHEIIEGVLRVDAVPMAALAACRTITNVSVNELPEPFAERTDGGLNERAQHRLSDLRRRLEVHLGDDFWTYPAEWSGADVTSDHIGHLPESLAECMALPIDSPLSRKFCGKVWSRLSSIIRREIDEFAKRPTVAFDRDVHKLIERRQAAAVQGREDDRREIVAALTRNETRTVAVIAPSGMGKTALVARIAQDLRSRFPSALVLTRFAGTTQGSTQLRDLLEDIVGEIQEFYGLSLPRARSVLELVNQLRTLLEHATPQQPQFILIDGVDELAIGDRAHDLTWLPTQPPPNAHVLVSALPGRCAEAAARLLPAANILAISQLSLEEGSQLLDRLLAELGRGLTPGQRRKVLGGFRVERSPLFLRLAVARVASWRSYFPDDVTQLPTSVATLTRLVLDDLASPARHGPVLLKRTLAYLLAGRFGLSDDELGRLLSQDNDVRRDLEGQSQHASTDRDLPPVVLARVLSDIRPFLREDLGPSGTTLVFRHGQVAGVAAGAAGETMTAQTAHRILGAFFRRQYDEKKERSQTSDLSREVAELPFQLREAPADWAEVKRLLCDVDFVIDKCGAGFVRDLLSDFESSVEALIAHPEDLDVEWRSWEEFMRLETDNLAVAGGPNAALVLQQAFNMSAQGAVPEAAERRICSGVDAGGEWIARLNRPQRAKPRTVRRLHHRQVKHLTVIDSRRALSVAPDFAIEIWDLDTGETLVRTASHATSIEYVRVVGANRVVSASDDGQVRLSRIDSGEMVCQWDAGLRRPVLATDSQWLLMAIRKEDGFSIATVNSESGAVVSTSEAIFGIPRVVTRSAGQTVVGTYGGGVHLIEPGHAALAIAPERNPGSWNVAFLAGHAFVYPDRNARQDTDVSERIQVWDLKSQSLAYELESHGAVPEQFLSIGANEAFCLAWPHQVEIRRLGDGTLLRKAPTGGRMVKVIGMDRDQRHLIMQVGTDALVLWRPDEDVASRVFQEERLGAPAMIASDQLLVASSKFGELLIWDIVKGAWIGTVSAGMSHPPKFAPISADRFLAFDDGTVGVWGFDELRAATGADEIRLAGRDPVIVAPSLGVVRDGTKAQLWNLDTGKMQLLAEHKGTIKNVVRISDDTMATLGEDCRVILWDLLNAQSRGAINGDGVEFRSVVPLGQKVIATIRDDGVCALWDPTSVQCIAQLSDGEESISAVAKFAPSDTLIVAAYQSGSLRVFDASNGEPRQHIVRPRSTVAELITLADSVLVKSHRGDLFECTIEMLVNPSDPQLAPIVPDAEVVSHLATHEEILVIADRDHGVRAWNLASRECMWTVTAATIGADPRLIPQFRLLPDEKCAIEFGPSVAIWDLRSGRHIENSSESLSMLASGVAASPEGLRWGSVKYPLSGYPTFVSAGSDRVLLTEQDGGVVHVLERRRIEAPAEPTSSDKDSAAKPPRQNQGLRVEAMVRARLPTTIYDRIFSITTCGVVTLTLSVLGIYGLASALLGVLWTSLAAIGLLFVTLLGIGMITLGRSRRARVYWLGEGATRRARGDLEGALAAFEKCRSFVGKAEPPGPLALIDYEAAGVLHELGCLPEALKRLQSAEPFFAGHGRLGQMHERCLMGMWLVSRELVAEGTTDSEVAKERLRVLTLLEECYRLNGRKVLLQGTQAERYILLNSAGRHEEAADVAMAFQRDHPEEYAAPKGKGDRDPLLDWVDRMGFAVEPQATAAQMSVEFDDKGVGKYRSILSHLAPKANQLHLDAKVAEEMMRLEVYDRALDLFRQVADRAAEMGDEKVAIPAIANQAIALIRLGRPGEAEPLFQEAEARARATHDDQTLKILLGLKAEEILRSAGDPNLAMASALSLAELLANDLDGWTRAVWQVHSAAVAGADAASELARVEALAEEANRRAATQIWALLLQCRAVIFVNQGAPVAQRRQAFEEVERAALDHPDIRAVARANLAMLNILEVELSTTIRTLKELRRDFLRADQLAQAEAVSGNIRRVEGLIDEEADRLDRLAEQAVSKSAWLEALDHVQTSVMLLREINRPRRLAEGLGIRGYILRQLDRQNEADESIAEAVALAEEHQLDDILRRLRTQEDDHK